MKVSKQLEQASERIQRGALYLFNAITGLDAGKGGIIMTTTLKNVQFSKEIQSFKNGKTPVNPIVLLYAMADCLKVVGPEWLKTNEAKALVHSINMTTHGLNYKIDGTKEQARLEAVFQQTTLTIY